MTLGAFSGDNQSSAEQIVLATPDRVELPDADGLFRSDFAQDGQDLVISLDGTGTVRVAGYFEYAAPPDLATPNGAILRGENVVRLSGAQDDARLAFLHDSPGGGQSGALVQDAVVRTEAIGQVETIEGQVTVTRTDGTIEVLSDGDFLFQNDAVETSAEARVSLTFVDGTIFSVGPGARMVLTEVIFDPDADNNSATFDLIEGGFVFIAGQVARTGGIAIDTPTSTLGIRGTTGLIQMVVQDGVVETLISLLADPDGSVGQIDAYDACDRLPGAGLDGCTLLAALVEENEAWIVSPEDGQTRQVSQDVVVALSDPQLVRDAITANEIVQLRIQSGGSIISGTGGGTPGDNAAPGGGGQNDQGPDNGNGGSGGGAPQAPGAQPDAPAPAPGPQTPQEGVTEDAGELAPEPDGPTGEDGSGADQGDLVPGQGVPQSAPNADGVGPGDGAPPASGDGTAPEDAGTGSGDGADGPETQGSADPNDQTGVPGSAGGSQQAGIPGIGPGGATDSGALSASPGIGPTGTAADGQAATSGPSSTGTGIPNPVSVADGLTTAELNQVLDALDAAPGITSTGTGTPAPDGFGTGSSFQDGFGSDSSLLQSGNSLGDDGLGTSSSTSLSPGSSLPGSGPAGSPGSGLGDTSPPSSIATATTSAPQQSAASAASAAPTTGTAPEQETQTVSDPPAAPEPSPDPGSVDPAPGQDPAPNPTPDPLPTNSPPVATGGELLVTLDGASATGSLSGSDPDNDPVTFQIVSQPATGAVALDDPTTGAFTFTPGPGFTGTDTFSFTVTDDQDATSEIQSVTLRINQIPETDADTGTVNQDGTVAIAVLSNDSDVDGDTLSLTAVSDPVNGQAVINPDGTISYTPDTDFITGQDSFTYTVTDGNGGTTTGTVVVNVNANPIAPPQTASTGQDEPAVIDVLANASDIDGGTLSVVGLGAATNGIAELQPNGNVLFTPASGFAGPAGFSFTVSDGQGGSTTSNVAVTVIDTTVPEITIAPATGDGIVDDSEDDGVTFAGTATVADGTPVTVRVLDPNGTATGLTTTVSVTSGAWSAGPFDLGDLVDGDGYSLEVTATDGGGTATETQPFSLPDTTPPEIAIAPATGDDQIDTGEAGSVVFSGTTDAPDGASITVRVLDPAGVPTGLSDTAIASGGNWTTGALDLANLATAATYTLEATTTDAAGNTTTQTRTFELAPPTPAPTIAIDPVTGDDAVDDAEDDAVSFSGTTDAAEGTPVAL
ncbi:MAG: Ig-like domain-containing protein, partial [Pseudomonadota bacterium]